MTLDRVPWFGRHVENLGDVIIYPVLVVAQTANYLVLFTHSPPAPPSERRQTRASYELNGFPVCCRNKQRNFTNDQTS